MIPFLQTKPNIKKLLTRQILKKSQRLPHEAYLKHFVNDLQQDIPLWAYVDLLTISDISFLYAISEPNIKDEVARTFGLSMKKGAAILGSYMHSMTIIRNLCAHGSRIYNRLFEQKPSLNKKEKALLITNADGQIDNAHFYGFVLVMRRLLPSDKFVEMKNSIITLTQKYPFVRMDYYGFRNDWKQKL
jgi:abortive infection bacteriophage resistance protein